MERVAVLAGGGVPGPGPHPQPGLEDLPDELLLRILRRVEDVYVALGETSAEFLELRAVCRRLRQGVDAAVTNLSRGIAAEFLRRDSALEFRGSLQPQLALWPGLRRLELRIHQQQQQGSSSHSHSLSSSDSLCPLRLLLPPLTQSCPELASLHIEQLGAGPSPSRGPLPCEALSGLTALSSLSSLSLSGFQTRCGTLPSLPSLRVLATDFADLLCAFPLPALEELSHGDMDGAQSHSHGSRHGAQSTSHSHSSSDGIHLSLSLRARDEQQHILPRLRRLSLARVSPHGLRLPSSLQVLELVNIHRNRDLDRGRDRDRERNNQDSDEDSDPDRDQDEWANRVRNRGVRDHNRVFNRQGLDWDGDGDRGNMAFNQPIFWRRGQDGEWDRYHFQLDLRADFPELSVLVVVQEGANRFPLGPAELSKLLSRSTRLVKLKIHQEELGARSGSGVEASLGLHTGLTSLSLRGVAGPELQLQEAVAALTGLKELELQDVKGLEALHLGAHVHGRLQLQLQHLRLEALPDLRQISGLEGQTALTSLTLASPSLSRARGNAPHPLYLGLFTRLTELDLSGPQLHHWNSDSCFQLPRLSRLRVAESRQLAPPELASLAPQMPAGTSRLARASPPTPAGPVSPVSPGFQALRVWLKDLDLGGVRVTALDLTFLPLLESLCLSDCRHLTRLSGLHHLPHLHSLRLLPSIPSLLSLSIASCPRLACFTCRLDHLQLLTLEDLPLLRLPFLSGLPLSLHRLHVAACPLLERLELGTSQCLPLGTGTGRSQPHPMQLRVLKLAGLAKLSGLVIRNAGQLTSVHVSHCPLTELVLENLPKLSAPGIHINDLYLHGAISFLLPSLPLSLLSLSPSASLPSPIRNSETQPVFPPPPESPQTPQILRRLVLVGLSGPFTLDQVPFHTRLTHLTLDGLLLSRVPQALGSLTCLAELALTNVTVEAGEALPPDTLSGVKKLTVAGSTDLCHWMGSWTRTRLEGHGLASPPPVGAGLGPVGPENGAFWSLTRLDLVELTVGSLDVTRLVCLQELSVRRCETLTRLAGISDLMHLTCVKLVRIPRLHELALVRCPSLKSLTCDSVSPLHLHLEDLPSLELEGGCFPTQKKQASHVPAAEMRSLISLKLQSLPCLSIILKNLEALETIEVRQCSLLNEIHLEKLKSLVSMKVNGPNPGSLAGSESSASMAQESSQCIGRLSLVNMPKLESVVCPSTLQNVVICSCPALTTFPIIPLEGLRSLELSDVTAVVSPPWLEHAQRLQKQLGSHRPPLNS